MEQEMRLSERSVRKLSNSKKLEKFLVLCLLIRNFAAPMEEAPLVEGYHSAR